MVRTAIKNMSVLFALITICLFVRLDVHGANIEYYSLSINNVQATSLNCSDILKNGTAQYDPDTNTLTLNNAHISKRTFFGYNGFSYYAAIGSLDELTINLVGNNTIDVSSYDGYGTHTGIFTSGDLIITGDGTLTISGSYLKRGIYGGSLTLNSGTVNITSLESGVSLVHNKVLTINGGTLTAQGETAIAALSIDLSNYQDHAVIVGDDAEHCELYYNPLPEDFVSRDYVKIGPGPTIEASFDEEGNSVVNIFNYSDLPIRAELVFATYNIHGKMETVEIVEVVCEACSTVKVMIVEPSAKSNTAKAFLVKPQIYIPISREKEWAIPN